MKIKNLLTVLFLFISLTNNAQLIELSKLSAGKFYDSSVIKDSKNNIKGYFLLYESEKIKKETYNLEYVVLDENLTKVTNGVFEEMKFNSFLVKSERITVSVSYFNNKLLIQLNDLIVEGPEIFTRYRTLDLKTNTLSDRFIFRNGKIEINPDFDRSLENLIDNQTDKIFSIDGIGLVAFDFWKTTDKDPRKLYCFDDTFNKKWESVYQRSKNEYGEINMGYLNHSENYIVYHNHYIRNVFKTNPHSSLLVFDAKNGNLNFEYHYPDSKNYTYRKIRGAINGDTLTLFGNYSKKTIDGYIDDNNNLGVFKVTLNLKTGNVLEEKYFNWESLNSNLGIDKNGKIKEEGNIYIHDFVIKSNNDIIMVCEAYKNNPITTNDMYFIEFDSELKLKQVFNVNKFRNKFSGIKAHSSTMNAGGYFDYQGYHDLQDDEYLFYFNDYEKKSKNRNKNTKYGIVSYADGKFTRKTLELKTENSYLAAYAAKNGYIMLVEDFNEKNKPSTIRLEKIAF
jgi:hypothetical protein